MRPCFHRRARTAALLTLCVGYACGGESDRPNGADGGTGMLDGRNDGGVSADGGASPDGDAGDACAGVMSVDCTGKDMYLCIAEFINANEALLTSKTAPEMVIIFRRCLPNAPGGT